MKKTQANIEIYVDNKKQVLQLPMDKSSFNEICSKDYIIVDAGVLSSLQYRIKFSLWNDLLHDINSIEVKCVQEKNWNSISELTNIQVFNWILKNVEERPTHAVEIMRNELFQFLPFSSLDEVAEMMIEKGFVYGVGIIPKHLVSFFSGNTEPLELILINNLGWKSSDGISGCIVNMDNPEFIKRYRYFEFNKSTPLPGH